MDIYHNQRVYRHFLLLCQLLTHQLHQPVHLIVALLPIRIDLFDALGKTRLHLASPHDLRTVQNALPRMVLHPLRPLFRRVVHNTVVQSETYRSLHHPLYLTHPVLHVLLHRIHHRYKIHLLTLSAENIAQIFLSGLNSISCIFSKTFFKCG